jgi:hypothetical protein
LNIDLESNIVLNEVTVTADRKEKQSESAKMSNIKLQIAQIKNVPSLLGEKDVLKVLQLMPGTIAVMIFQLSQFIKSPAI